MRFITSKSYENWQNDLVNQATVDTYTVTIQNEHLNYICFDNLYSVSTVMKKTFFFAHSG